MIDDETADLALIGHAHKDMLQALELTEEKKQEIACAPLDEALHEANRLSALQDCLKKSGASLSVVNAAVRVRIHWRRRAGKLLEQNKAGGSRNVHPDPESEWPTYDELGLSSKSAHRMKDEARVPDPVVEDVIRKVEEAGERELTCKEIEKLGRKMRIDAEKAGWQSEEQIVGSAVVVKSGAIDYLWAIDPASVDMLLTDPPYATDVEDIRAFASSWLNLALSRIKSTGRAYVFVGAYPEEIHAYLDAFYRPRPADEPHSMGLDMILPWVYRNTIGPSTRDTYKLNWQACLYFKGPDAPPLNTESLNEKFSVQDFNAPDGRHGMRLHPWEKPAELAERFIEHATRPGDVVLDPFAGTGTFLACAGKLGRNGIGCEINEDMIAICGQKGIVDGTRRCG